MDILVINLAEAIVDPVLTPPRPPSKQRLTSLLDNPSGQSHIVQESQDSLSFPSLAPRLRITKVTTLTANEQASTDIEEMVKLQENNAKLKQELQTLQSNHDKFDKEFKSLTGLHYQLKLACLWTVDRNQQLALEFERIDQQYKEKNTQRDWRLTSWISPDDMFSWDDPLTTRTTSGYTILDWKELGWDFENATNSHHLANPLQAPQKLWVVPAKFVFDRTTCCICYNAFGSEGGFILGTYEHMYHPICLIAHMVIRWHCCQCKAPFHEQLYELFGLCPYMAPSWEHNPKTTPGMPSRWDDDLVWNWRMSAHTPNKSTFSFAIRWENDHEEIVRVANSIKKGNSRMAIGVHNFFYQYFKGYWDSKNQRFQFGTHPLGLIYNEAR